MEKVLYIRMEKEFITWFEASEKRFASGQFDEKQIAYAAWLEGKNKVFSIKSSPNFELQFCSNCLQMTNHLDNKCQKCKDNFLNKN